MSSKIINSKQIYSAKKPCCKVCVDAGKTEKEYSSHYVKDLNGNVLCPTLLNQECRFCHNKGHTTSHCPTLKKQKESKENYKIQKEKQKELKKCESQIEKVEMEIKNLEIEFENPNFYVQNPDKYHQKTQRLENCKKELAELLGKWATLG